MTTDEIFKVYEEYQEQWEIQLSFIFPQLQMTNIGHKNENKSLLKDWNNTNYFLWSKQNWTRN